MASYAVAYPLLQQAEGLYSNNPSDSGGETYRGVARNKNPMWDGWKIVDQLRPQPNFPKNLDANQDLQNLVQVFYRPQYWDVIKGDLITSQKIANELFDTGVNMGPSTAGQFVQHCLNVLNKRQSLFPDLTVDGSIGQKTVDSINKITAIPNGEQVLWKALNCLRGYHYVILGDNNPDDEDFEWGWFLNRIFPAA